MKKSHFLSHVNHINLAWQHEFFEMMINNQHLVVGCVCEHYLKMKMCLNFPSILFNSHPQRDLNTKELPSRVLKLGRTKVTQIKLIKTQFIKNVLSLWIGINGTMYVHCCSLSLRTLITRRKKKFGSKEKLPFNCIDRRGPTITYLNSPGLYMHLWLRVSY